MDAAGNLYGTTTLGGVHGDGAAFELTPVTGEGWTEKMLHSFSGTTDGSQPYAGVVVGYFESKVAHYPKRPNSALWKFQILEVLSIDHLLSRLAPMLKLALHKEAFMGGSRYHEIPCALCSTPVDLQLDLHADENGKAVHEDCYVKHLTNSPRTASPSNSPEDCHS
jgi:hypothetical protein